VPGDYVLRVSVPNSSTFAGAYSFRMLDLSNATAVAPGTEVTATLNPANSTNAYRFSATAGSR